MSTPAFPEGVRRLRERPVPGEVVPLHRLEDWTVRFPWLVHGTTGRGDDGEFDLGLFGETPVGDCMARWRTLRDATGLSRAVHSLQVHESTVLVHEAGRAGLEVTEGADGHVTEAPGILLTVAVADCVPIAIVDERRRRIALLHGGWRGTAAGIVEAGIERLGGDTTTLRAHLGPAICGDCYEVGPEVHEALGLPRPDCNIPVDVRAVQVHRLMAMGLAAARVTVSEHCTRCGEGFFSHRAGASGRQVGVLGIR